MAKKDNTQNANKQSGKKNIVGMTLGSVLAAAAVTFGVISVPVLGILTFGLSALIAAVGIGLAAMVISYNAKKYHNKNKSEKLSKQKNSKKEKVKEKQEEVQLVSVNENKIEEKPVIEEQKGEEQVQTPKMEEFLTEKVGPNTFAIYNQEASEILKDKNNKEMIYNISSDNRFRFALNNFAREFNELPNCSVVVRDAEEKETSHAIKKSTFRVDMTGLLKDIKSVRSKLEKNNNVVSNANTDEEKEMTLNN